MNKAILFTLATLLIHQDLSRMVGGFEEVDLEDCIAVRKSAFDKIHKAFENHKLTGCSKQLVNGINHKLVLESEGHVIPSCNLTIWHDFKKTQYQVLDRKLAIDDCMHKLDKTKNSMEL